MKDGWLDSVLPVVSVVVVSVAWSAVVAEMLVAGTLVAGTLVVGTLSPLGIMSAVGALVFGRRV